MNNNDNNNCNCPLCRGVLCVVDVVDTGDTVEVFVPPPAVRMLAQGVPTPLIMLTWLLEDPSVMRHHPGIIQSALDETHRALVRLSEGGPFAGPAGDPSLN